MPEGEDGEEPSSLRGDMMLETERLLIRRFKGGDWHDLHEYLSDPEVVFYEPYCIYTPEESKSEALRRAGDTDFWAVALKDGGKVIGNLFLSKQDFDTWELGFVFNKRFQGRGYALESAAALIEHAFKKHEARRIIAMCNPDNEKSWRLLERLGLRREGHLKRNIYFKTDGKGQPVWHDTYLYGILADEWKQKAGARQNDER
jgi:RimJ/RimL family protein N-acetyltransferase